MDLYLEKSLSRFKRFCESVDNPPVAHIPSRTQLYKLVKVIGEERKDVAFALTIDEAKLLSHSTSRRLSAHRGNEEETPRLEITEQEDHHEIH